MLERELLNEFQRIRYPERKKFITQFVAFVRENPNNIKKLTLAMTHANNKTPITPNTLCKKYLNRLLNIFIETIEMDNIDIEILRLGIERLLKIFNYPNGETIWTE